MGERQQQVHRTSINWGGNGGITALLDVTQTRAKFSRYSQWSEESLKKQKIFKNSRRLGKNA